MGAVMSQAVRQVSVNRSLENRAAVPGTFSMPWHLQQV